MIIRATGEYHRLTRRQALTLCYLEWDEIANMESYNYGDGGVEDIKAITDVVKRYEMTNDCAFCDQAYGYSCYYCLGLDMWPLFCEDNNESPYKLFAKTLNSKYARMIADFCADRLCDVNYW